jgi:hypothetical protein
VIGIHPTIIEFRYVNRGRSVYMTREYDPNDKQIGGVLVVVRNREILLHGEGAQLN